LISLILLRKCFNEQGEICGKVINQSNEVLLGAGRLTTSLNLARRHLQPGQQPNGAMALPKYGDDMSKVGEPEKRYCGSWENIVFSVNRSLSISLSGQFLSGFGVTPGYPESHVREHR